MAAHTFGELDQLVATLKWTFRDRTLLSRALTHASWGNEQVPPAPNYERLEFLGDAFIQITLARHLWASERGHDPGRLTLLRAAASHGEYQADLAKELGLGAVMRLGAGRSQPTKRLLGDVFEAVVGAMVADAEGDPGRERAAATWLIELMNRYPPDPWPGLFTAALNEWFQSRTGAGIPWGQATASGPKESLTWTIALEMPGGQWFEAGASSLKSAKGHAAEEALRSVGIELRPKEERCESATPPQP